MVQVLGSWSVPGWMMACSSMIFIGFGAAEIEQQGLHVTSSKLLELDSGFFFLIIFNGFGAAAIEQQGLHVSTSKLLGRPGLHFCLLPMISIGSGAAEIEQQSLRVTTSGLLERPGLDSGFFFNDVHWLRGC